MYGEGVIRFAHPDKVGADSLCSPSQWLRHCSNPLVGFDPSLHKKQTLTKVRALSFCGEGGIRTLEGCYTLPAFQASALDQLCDLSGF